MENSQKGHDNYVSLYKTNRKDYYELSSRDRKK
jgi:hypothetical protein